MQFQDQTNTLTTSVQAHRNNGTRYVSLAKTSIFKQVSVWSKYPRGSRTMGPAAAIPDTSQSSTCYISHSWPMVQRTTAFHREGGREGERETEKHRHRHTHTHTHTYAFPNVACELGSVRQRLHLLTPRTPHLLPPPPPLREGNEGKQN